MNPDVDDPAEAYAKHQDDLVRDDLVAENHRLHKLISEINDLAFEVNSGQMEEGRPVLEILREAAIGKGQK